MTPPCDDHGEIREEVRKLDEVRGYPTEFVTALTEAGHLSVLIPEKFGGSGLGLTAAV